MTPSRFNPQKPFNNAQGKHHRRSIRLPHYDYSRPGAYYVTIVTWHRELLFGEVVNGEMRLNKVGEIVQREWLELPERLRFIELGAFVVMPNHFHGILIFHHHVGAGRSDLAMIPSGKEAAQPITLDGMEGSPLPYHPEQNPPLWEPSSHNSNPA